MRQRIEVRTGKVCYRRGLFSLPRDGRMSDHNMLLNVIINESILFGCCHSVDYFANANDDLYNFHS